MQRRLVNIHRLLRVLFSAKRVEVGNRRHAARADANGVNFHGQCLRGFRGGQRRHFTGVVLAVGHQDDNLAF